MDGTHHLPGIRRRLRQHYGQPLTRRIAIHNQDQLRRVDRMAGLFQHRLGMGDGGLLPTPVR